MKRLLQLRLLGFGFLQDGGRRLSRGVRKSILGYFLFSDKTPPKSCECWRYKIEGNWCKLPSTARSSNRNPFQRAPPLEHSASTGMKELS